MSIFFVFAVQQAINDDQFLLGFIHNGTGKGFVAAGFVFLFFQPGQLSQLEQQFDMGGGCLAGDVMVFEPAAFPCRVPAPALSRIPDRT
jgi:hypothetical protein